MFKRNKKQLPLEEQKKEKRKEGIGLLRGMKDTLPQDAVYWRWVYETAERLARSYGYERLDVPHLEDLRLFVRAVGKDTDIVEKELFSFPDRDNVAIALRPEFTAGFARAYIEHGFVNLPQPVRLYTVGSLFRYERPQAGRFREHHQWDVEVMGDGHPVLDAEVILLAVKFFQALGIPVTVSINSLGCGTCRPAYRETFLQYVRGKKKVLCENCQRRLTRNPLRILDCKEEQCQTVREGAPQIVDWVCEECKNHFIRVLEYCDALSVPYELSPYLVRGLDYYTKTVFECFGTRVGEEGTVRIALAGGGRYDDLVAFLGSRPTPAVGFGVGLERVLSELKIRSLAPPVSRPPAVFVAQLGEAGREKALGLAEELRAHGISIRTSFSKDGLKAQLELAQRDHVALTLIIGQKEVLDETVMIREMEGGVQEIVPYDKVVGEVQKRISSVVT